MTVKIFIPQVEEKNQEYNWHHERRALIDLARSIYKLYHASAKFYAIVVSIKSPPADVIIITEDGLGVIELKNYGGWLWGDNQTHWTVTGGGKTDRIEAGQKNNQARLNPLQQVNDYTATLKYCLKQSAPSKFTLIPAWLPTARWQTTVCFTKKIRWDKKSLRVNQPGFQITTLDTIAEWVATLAFGNGKQLTQNEILFVISLLGCREWPEAEHICSPGVLYGYLWVLEDGRESWRMVLDQDDMCLGRDPECGALRLDETYSRVSRHHAQIRREGDKIFIYDGYREEGSTNGTFVNKGQRVDRITGHELKEGDKIVLGDCDDKECHHPKKGTCVLYFRPFNLAGKPLKTAQ